jgi:hypothetical protein
MRLATRAVVLVAALAAATPAAAREPYQRGVCCAAPS